MSGDPLLDILKQQDLLLEEGIVVWASLVQANELLFKPGRHDHPAVVLYCTNPGFDDQPEGLRAVARKLFSVKGKLLADPVLQPFANMLCRELSREMRMPVPQSLTGSAAVYCTNVIVARRHLPARTLDHALFPLVIHPTCDATMILPSRFWPDELLSAWEGVPA
ncbi:MULTISPECIES: hypothetical protein [unclassified Streptomyces]|uniref:hypothetical protein n=1 Tax=unclassified Streptomyces TaxID=2593676 RepID=UPI002E81C492|nr:hypothetical protein [Streptomyces sp. NBC_00589]WTI37723.1 hypothetical protein OIC96_23295 [Streptomyces sp. NBC_00775]WUB28598.1 hypothetical protein OHA51_26440 [Streptomyces sp. NBC_00589]